MRTINDLIEILRNVDDSPTSECGFDMKTTASGSHFSNHLCGKACCIGGHAAIYLRAPYMSTDKAIQEFGINEKDAFNISYPPVGSNAWHAKPAQAIRLLRILEQEGVVDWDRAMKEVS